ncbi:cysteine hydrolase family protein [Pseudalkalibacillus berkeleyi]|uniref:Cysteine hydrolase n=1 Tax=Pseudalkalibacillus berkeleyi TaxID=1069813 RepID=A0ABS9GXJ6_9BACL|nr:cysteine hydrolase family protein [Pseudalkalibacillus berkeleyi]MCF6136349.1 cysteine hydrolase [Pseudalkalibacillus berkeleyi]
MKDALIVIDVQEAVMENSYQEKETIEQINELILRARSNQIPIIYVQHEYPIGPMKRGEPNWQLHEHLEKPLESDIIINKTLPNAFSDTSLKEVLNQMDIRHVYICGAQTDFCVDSTCRGAFDNHYDVTLITDAHTTTDKSHMTSEQIINHVHQTLENFWSPKATLTLQKSDEVKWMVTQTEGGIK